MDTRTLSSLNVVALIAVLAVNAMANVLPINGLQTGEVSALYPSLFTPAGFTFSIWSVIYLLLIGFSIFQWRINTQPYFSELSLWYLVSCIANLSWILCWHHLYLYASVVIMLVLLFTLIKIFILLKSITSYSPVEKIFIRLPFVIYLSWICVATIANISALLVSLNWNGGLLTPVVWTMTMITIASVVGIFISRRYREPSFLLVLIWAFWGIYSKWRGTENNMIAETALIELMVLVVLFIIFQLAQSNPDLFRLNRRKLFR